MAHFVSEIMTTSLDTAELNDTLESAREKMIRGGFRHLPILSKGRLVGVLSDRDIGGVAHALVELDAGSDVYERYLAQPCGNLLKARFLAGDIVTLLPSDSIENATDLFVRNRLSAIPVVDGNELVGILSYIDVMRAISDSRRSAARGLSGYSARL